jgi:hypothetical protein
MSERRQSYEKCTIADEHGKREFHNVNGVWYNELMTEGEWSLYQLSEEMFSQNSNKWFGTKPESILVHSRIYSQTRPVYEMVMPVIWCGNEDDECVPVTHTTERYDAVCHTELWPTDFDRCTKCNARIPDKFLVIWRMLNADCMDKTL